MIAVFLILLSMNHNPVFKSANMYGYRTPLLNKIDPRCYNEEYIRAWVYFTDKGIQVDDYDKVIRSVKKIMPDAARKRRITRGGIIDYADIPVDREYISEVEALGGLFIRESKWLNAASFWIAKEDLAVISELVFVQKITPVAYFQGSSEIEAVLQDTSILGHSLKQLTMFNIDKLHNKGFFGANIKIGFLDTGLRRKHTALDIVRVTSEHDFLEGDQVYMGNTPITGVRGVYSDICFWKTNSRLNLFLPGDTTFNFQPVRDILYTYSTDGGSYWQPLEKITNSAAKNWTRELTVCGADTIFIIYRDKYGLKYLVYQDSLLVPSMPLIQGGYREPSAVQVKDTVYVTYQNKNYLYLQKGNILGFQPETIIDSSQSHIKAPEMISDTATARIGVFYHTLTEDSIYFLKWSIGDTAFTKKFVGVGKDVEAISFADTIFLIWKDKSNDPLSKIVFSKSSDFGDTFTEPLLLSDDLNSVGKISIAKLNEAITVLWETNAKIYYRNSFNNGSSFNALDSLNNDFVYLPTLGTNTSEILEFYCTRGDSSTDGYSSNDPEYEHPRHGTEMLGIIGGYLHGSYVGVAPAAEFLVAKTENRDANYEFPVEEDTWIAGLEWAESKGIDIVNSSLGYTDWYTWPQDYDGNTSPASIAAYEASKRGMIVVNSSGNIPTSLLPRIVVPGDAKGIITVGGIDTLLSRWVHSGYGPTFDGRMKPELVSLSDAPLVVDPDSSNSYLYSIGTSGAAAIISGICALLLEGHPSWNIDSVKTVLFATASHADNPSDSIGYGWPDALAAFDASPTPFDTLAGAMFLTPYPNPFILNEHSNIFIPFKLETSHTIEIRLYSINGRLIKKEKREGMLLPGRYTDENPNSPNASFIWDGKDTNGDDVSSGVYYCLLLTRGGKNDIAKIAVIK